MAKHKNEYVMRVVENAVVNEVYQRRATYKDTGEDKESFVALNHYTHLTETRFTYLTVNNSIFVWMGAIAEGMAGMRHGRGD